MLFLGGTQFNSHNSPFLSKRMRVFRLEHLCLQSATLMHIKVVLVKGTEGQGTRAQCNGFSA